MKCLLTYTPLSPYGVAVLAGHPCSIVAVVLLHDSAVAPQETVITYVRDGDAIFSHRVLLDGVFASYIGRRTAGCPFLLIKIVRTL